MVAVAILVAIGVAVRSLPVLHWIALGAREAHRAGVWGAIAWLGIVYALMLLLVPTVPLIIASGWLFGVWGAAIALPAAAGAAASAFALARALGRSDAARALLDHPKARALADLAEEGGAWTVALVRLAPILPFTPTNGVLGLTGMRFACTPGTWISLRCTFLAVGLRGSGAVARGAGGGTAKRWSMSCWARAGQAGPIPNPIKVNGWLSVSDFRAKRDASGTPKAFPQ